MDFEDMKSSLRQFKDLYIFRIFPRAALFLKSKRLTGAKRMSFSSYAGYLVSLDDFYIMDRYEHVTVSLLWR